MERSGRKIGKRTRNGRDRRGEELPAELVRRETRVQKIQPPNERWKSEHGSRPRARVRLKRKLRPTSRCKLQQCRGLLPRARAAMTAIRA